ncbi:LamG domain-containing protein [Pontiella sulfatireligans]|uniref:Uncharacterized protein n=1 Tax=Pontiella sulfatireligans TaxID=2750658 RepID=A0A6C2UH66_9BACT|nr:LamG domain-containing protein [Pontiella sulfatireligans]VGO19468.1 hypothetical protein SCARR_01527 [Pontiella sulfatireligans]
MRSLFIKISLFGLVVCAAGQLSAGTVGFWRFEPGATRADSSGNGLTLTRTSTDLKVVDRPSSGSGSYLSIIPQTGAENDGVAHLDGLGKRFYVADTNLFDFGSNAFTFETFVTPTTNGFQTVVEKVDEWRMGINEASGKLTLSLYDGVSEWKTALKIFDGATSFTAGNDYYVAAVVAPGVSNTVVSFYYQNLTAGGELLSDVKTIAGINSLNNSAEPFNLNGNIAGRSMDYMDEVRLSSGALSQSELFATFPELGFGVLSRVPSRMIPAETGWI